MSRDRNLLRLERQIWELLAWRNLSTTPLEPWTATGNTGEIREIRVGDRWDDLGSQVRLESTLDAPQVPGSLLEVFVEGDGLVFLDGERAGTVSPFEREIPLGDARKITIEVSPNDDFGLVSRNARFMTCRIVQPNQNVRALFRHLLLAWETCADAANDDLVPFLVDAIERSLSYVKHPSDTKIAMGRMKMLRDDLKLQLDAARSLGRHYHYLAPRNAIEHVLGETDHLESLHVDLPASPAPAEPDGVRQALDFLFERVTQLTTRFPRSGSLALSAHAHLDVAWLWPLVETRRKARHTFANVVTLMDRYPNFRFTASSAQLYAFVQQDDPELFERVRHRIAEGRWEPIGGMWLEPDCNLPSGESLVRHLLYGQRYFDREFGRRSSVAWLPDTFGMSGNLPQILAGAGMRAFFTQKLSWNDTNRFPHDLWLWEGIDGTRLISHSFENPIGGYNGQVTPKALEATWNNYDGKSRHSESLFTYGMGDGGRGPTSDMLERLDLLKEYPALPEVRHTTVEEFFDGIGADNLPVWAGELYLEFHRGTYTTQSRLKRLNRIAEHRLQEAETVATLASLGSDPYPKAELDEWWTTLLRNQFHDILPGSSIREVNEQAELELGSVVQHAIEIRDRGIRQIGNAFEHMSDQSTMQILVVNPQGCSRPLFCVLSPSTSLSEFSLIAPDGSNVAWQPTADGDVLIHDSRIIVPGTGYVSLTVAPGGPSVVTPNVTADEHTIENDLLEVTIDGDGSIASLFDKRVGREVFDGPGNQLRVYHDVPAAWEAWNLTDTSNIAGEAISHVESLRVLENGPLRACVEVRRRFASSTITQRYLLRAGSARLDIQTEIDWAEKRRLLRAIFPLAVRSMNATFETIYGAVERPTHRNTSWDAARFEVPAHRWADLSEPGYGVSLLNDGRYGHSALENVLGISLLRSPMDPDPLADLGKHEFTYSIYPHTGDWFDGGTVNEAIDLNSPLIGQFLGGEPATTERLHGSWFQIEGLTLGSLKRAEDSSDLVLRLYDPYGRRGVARIKPQFPVQRASLADLLEEDAAEVTFDVDGSLQVPYRPFQIVTLKVKPG